MSRYRKGAGGKRDANEPDIIKTLRANGCVVMQLSGKGIPDLLVLRNGTKWLADVKMPGKSTTAAQEELWEEAATKARCAVFILRTPEDAQKMLNNALQPWEPSTVSPGEGVDFTTLPGGWKKRHRCGKDGCRRLRPCNAHSLHLMEHYTPPRSKPVDAAKEAEVFAPPQDPSPFTPRCALGGCSGYRLYGKYCGEHRGMGD